MLNNITYSLYSAKMLVGYNPNDTYAWDNLSTFGSTIGYFISDTANYYLQIQSRILLILIGSCRLTPMQIRNIWNFITYIVLPMIYVHLARPAAPKITIHVPGAGAVLVREGPEVPTNELSQIDLDIIYHLRRFQQGCTAKMLMRALLSVYPEMELEDVNRRLYSLQQAGHVRSFEGNVVSRMWVAMI